MKQFASPLKTKVDGWNNGAVQSSHTKKSIAGEQVNATGSWGTTRAKSCTLRGPGKWPIATAKTNDRYSSSFLRKQIRVKLSAPRNKTCCLASSTRIVRDPKPENSADFLRGA